MAIRHKVFLLAGALGVVALPFVASRSVVAYHRHEAAFWRRSVVHGEADDWSEWSLSRRSWYNLVGLPLSSESAYNHHRSQLVLLGVMSYRRFTLSGECCERDGYRRLLYVVNARMASDFDSVSYFLGSPADKDERHSYIDIWDYPEDMHKWKAIIDASCQGRELNGSRVDQTPAQPAESEPH